MPGADELCGARRPCPPGVVRLSDKLGEARNGEGRAGVGCRPARKPSLQA